MVFTWFCQETALATCPLIIIPVNQSDWAGERKKDLYLDVSNFLDLFEDLSKKEDLLKKNEFVLKHFFRSSDPTKRKKIDVDDYSYLENNDVGIPVEVNQR